MLEPDEPITPFGYASLSFAFHPGDVTPEDGDRLSVQGIDLLNPDQGGPVVDLSRKEWQVVEIPYENLAAGRRLNSIRFAGNWTGTFYLDDLRLTAYPPATEPGTAVVEEQAAAVPPSFVLGQNYPNPANNGTVIRFGLDHDEHVNLSLYNLAGQKVATLVHGPRTAGTYAVHWDGRDDSKRALASGVYLYRLHAGAGQVDSRKLLLLR